MAYSVTQRTNEIGIRMALGATRKNILQLVLRQGSLLALGGIGLGMIASVLVTRVLSSLLFAVSPRDPGTFFAVGLAACGSSPYRELRSSPTGHEGRSHGGASVRVRRLQ